MRKRFFFPFISFLLLTCCATPVKKGAESIRIHFDSEEIRKCEYLGEVVGSKGQWYSSWIISNKVLTEGAINDLRNSAQAVGADTIFIPSNLLLFRTSVTLLGQAYRCNK